MKTFIQIDPKISPEMPACVLSEVSSSGKYNRVIDIFTRPTMSELLRDAANLIPVKYNDIVVVSSDFAVIQSDTLSLRELLEISIDEIPLDSRRYAKFCYNGKRQIVRNIDPSEPKKLLNRAWNELVQEVFDQVEGGDVFNKSEVTAISELSIEKFLLCIQFIINR